MTHLLLQEILKANDSLQLIEFNLNNKDFKFYYRYLTLLEKARIEQMCVKANIEINNDGSRTTTYKKQDFLYPIHLILEKALDKEGKRLFSHTDPQHFDIISKLPANLASFISYQMSIDVMGNLKDTNE
jgi:hypothetical protein